MKTQFSLTYQEEKGRLTCTSCRGGNAAHRCCRDEAFPHCGSSCAPSTWFYVKTHTFKRKVYWTSTCTRSRRPVGTPETCSSEHSPSRTSLPCTHTLVVSLLWQNQKGQEFTFGSSATGLLMAELSIYLSILHKTWRGINRRYVKRLLSRELFSHPPGRSNP